MNGGLCMSNFAFYGFLNHVSKHPFANMIWGKDSVTQTNNGKVAFHTSKDVASLYETYLNPDLWVDRSYDSGNLTQAL